MTRRIRTLVMLVFVIAGSLATGCKTKEPQYGTELQLGMPGLRRQTWAVAPAVDLSGQNVDPLLQADILYGQLQQVHGLTVIPVNRVVEVFESLKIAQLQSEEQAAVVCELLGVDGIVVPTVTLYDPYNPPKFGGSLQLFDKSMNYARPAAVDPRQLSQEASPDAMASLPPAGSGNYIQAVGLFDASNGSTRQALWMYADGRHDPVGPLGQKEYLVSMDRYCGFAYSKLIKDLLYRSGNR